MDRHAFRKLFKTTGPAVLPVIHVRDCDQTLRNVRVAVREGAPGVFLINHNFSYTELLPTVRDVRREMPSLWLGVNFLGVTGLKAFPILGQLSREGTPVDAYWADNACIDEHQPPDRQPNADAIRVARDNSKWAGLYFGGTAFKCQRSVEDSQVGAAGSVAARFMDVVTTSGVGTGVAARVEKLRAMREGCGSVAMALASGVTPANATEYAPLVDCLMVATGISLRGDFYNIDSDLLRALLQVARGCATAVRTDAWYLRLMAPNTRGKEFAWLDPSSVYMDSSALSDLTSDLLAQFDTKGFDLVAGIDAMGFPLAATIALKSRKGFLTLRKSGRLAVDVEEQDYECYSGPGKVMEVRTRPFTEGTRVLLVDQWIQTGGTMLGAIRLVEKLGGVVAGLATIACEANFATAELARRYKLAHVVPPVLQPYIDDHTFLGSQMHRYLNQDH